MMALRRTLQLRLLRFADRPRHTSPLRLPTHFSATAAMGVNRRASHRLRLGAFYPSSPLDSIVARRR